MPWLERNSLSKAVQWGIRKFGGWSPYEPWPIKQMNRVVIEQIRMYAQVPTTSVFQHVQFVYSPLAFEAESQTLAAACSSAPMSNRETGWLAGPARCKWNLASLFSDRDQSCFDDFRRLVLIPPHLWIGGSFLAPADGDSHHSLLPSFNLDEENLTLTCAVCVRGRERE